MDYAKSLLVFEAVYNSSNFKEASQRVNFSTATISRELKKLEALIGKKLFSQSGKKFVPTNDGVLLYTKINGIAEQYTMALNEFKSNSNSFTILIPPQLSFEGILKLYINDLDDGHNLINVQEISNFKSRNEALECVAYGDIDLFLDIKPIHEFNFSCTKLCKTNFYAIGSSKYYDADFLTKETLLNLNRKFVTINWLNESGKPLLDILEIPHNKKISVVTDSLISFLDTIEISPFIGFIPESLRDKLIDSEKFVFSKEPVGYVPLYSISAPRNTQYKTHIKIFQEKLMDLRM